MVAFSKDDLERWSGGKWEGGAPRNEIVGFGIDSRKLSEGEMFVAIQSERRDGHDFISQAVERGAAGALTNRYLSNEDLPQLVVSNTEEALRRIAAEYRKTCDGTVIAVTGSCGKTTVKDLIAQLLEGQGNILKTEGNLNNLLGVPLTLLRSHARDSEYLIIEAGISEPGEMDCLAKMIRADFVVFTSIGPAHLEDLKDVKTIAREKGKLFSNGYTRKSYLGETCVPFEEHFGQSRERVARNSALTKNGEFDFSAEKGQTQLKLRIGDEIELYRFSGFGVGLASNVALAIKVVRDQGVSKESVADRLSKWEASSMRGQWVSWTRGMIFLDCYNANPLSMDDALETFLVMSVGESRLFVVGCMEELGEASSYFHRKLGASLPLGEKDRAIVIGSSSADVAAGARESGKSEYVTIIESIDEIEPYISGFSGDLFVKGSRRYHLENIMNFVECEANVSKENPC